MRRVTLLMAVVGLSISLIFSAGIVQAATITVGGACTLTLAIQEANTTGASGGACVAGAAGADTIVLAAATTYNPTAGPFAANGNNDFPNITSTIIIDGNGATIAGGGNYRIFHIAATGNLTLNNLTLQNGRANDGLAANNQADNGGGIYTLGVLTVNNSLITGNTAQVHGGGIYSTGANSNVTINASTIGGTTPNRTVIGSGGGIWNTAGGQVFIQGGSFISGNIAFEYGGGIRNESPGSLVTVVDSTIGGTNGNQVTSGSGGGITNELNARLIVQNSTVSGNTAAAGGAGIYNGNGNVTIVASVIGGANPNITLSQTGGGLWNNLNGVMLLQNGTQVSNNTAPQSAGGIFNAGQLTINSSSVINNVSSFGGAMYNNLEGTILIENNSLISGNRATSLEAGGIFNYGALTIDASEISLNTVTGDGGGILTASNTGFPASVIIRNRSRIVGNAATTGRGGALYNLGGTGQSTVTITDSIVDTNTAAQGGAIYNFSNTAQTINNSCIEGNSTTSVFNAAATAINATGNWWNAADGPSGAGPGTGDSVSVNVTFTGFLPTPPFACNRPPVANNDTATTAQGVAVIVNVLANDTDTDGTLNPATVIVVGAPANGTTAVNPVTGAVTYTPNPAFAGPTDTFTYTVQDDDGAPSNVATVTITVTPTPNQAPVANNDTATTAQGVAVIVNVLANDTDTDGTLNPATVTVVGAPANGTTAVNPVTGAVTYTPNPAFAGPTDTFTYTVQDDDGATSNTATVTITISAVPNQAPVANNDNATTPQGAAVVVNVLANDTDADGTLNPATVAVVGAPANGTTAVNPITGAITYTPNPAFAGPTDTFTYTVQDDDAATSNVATVTVAISSVVVPPVGGGTASSGSPIDLRPAACSALNTQLAANLRVTVPAGTVTNGDVYCRVIVRDNLYIQDSSEIGRQTVIDLGIIQAVDLFGLRTGGQSAPDFNNAIEVCLSGSGSLLYLNALAAPRVLQPVSSVTEGDYTCAAIPDAGTVVLIADATNAPPASVTELQNCRVTTTHAVRLRIEPDTSSPIITTLPYDLTLTATERQGNWFRVIYLDGQGWVSGVYLHTAGTCAD